MTTVQHHEAGKGLVLPLKPGKVIAVHLNYRSRAAERGREPAYPSYFLKPSTTVAASGDPVVRPRGCQLLAFEGEIALVIGKTARQVALTDGWSFVEAVTAANDFGVYDLRHADGGSNVRSKGVDGYTPLGPQLLAARGLDPSGLRLRTWVNGELVQDALTAEELLFGFDLLVADLSRLMTLERGDVILTGTPTGSTVVEPGDVVEVEVTTSDGRTTGRLTSPVEAGCRELSGFGAMPRVDASTRSAAYGARRVPGSTGLAARFDEATLVALRTVSTATVAAQLRKRGIDGCTMDSVRPARTGSRFVGLASTLRYLPLRADLFTERGGGMNAQKQAIDSVGQDEVLVIEARGATDAGTVGDILALRAQVRGAAGIVTDGAVRDVRTLAELSLPVFHRGQHSAVLGRRHVPWETGVAVACAGITVQPGELVMGDDDGVVLIPNSLVVEVAAAALEQELEERFITEQVAAGASIKGLYPIGDDWRDRYQQWRKGMSS
jgi:2-keto-4-pentenoate hydratase/2-oxohepta-3-ene-1,7-dioic acid hydratase in catechol pathway/regulator of RNase E activity RraA